MPKINKKKTVQIVAKTVRVHVKVVDSGSYTLKDEQGEEIAAHEGYVPGFFPEEHYGDYLDLEIDLDTGKILNWKPVTAKAVEEWLKNVEEGTA